jgi:small-conductance mechanosensitive channel
MPQVDLSGVVNAIGPWVQSNGLLLLAVTVGLFIFYRLARPVIHRLLVRIFAAQAASRTGDPDVAAESEKRLATMEDLFARLLQGGVVFALVLVVFAVFDLWPLLAGLGLVAAAITLAGQSIVLDYLMGILILVEGQYFNGDTVVLGGIEGTVEEVGIRRTVIRDNRGVVHSISNGLVRQSSNMTRTYAIALIHLEGIAERDVDAAIAVIDAVGREIQADPEWSDRLLEAPRYTGTTALRSTGATLRMAGRVRADARVLVETELRRRLAKAVAAAGIEVQRPTTTATPTT